MMNITDKIKKHVTENRQYRKNTENSNTAINRPQLVRD